MTKRGRSFADAALSAVRTLRADMPPLSVFRTIAGGSRPDLKYEPFFDPRRPSSAVESNTSWVAICTRHSSDVVSSIPLLLGVRRRGSVDGEIEAPPAWIANDPAGPIALMETPHTRISWQSLRRFVDVSLHLFGAAYVQKVRRGGPTPVGASERARGNTISSLLPLPFCFVHAEVDQQTRQLRKWVFAWGGKTQELHPDDVWVITQGTNPDNPFSGRATLEDCPVAADLNFFVHASRANFFRNGARVGGVITTNQHWDELDPEPIDEPIVGEEETTPATVPSRSLIDRFYEAFQRHHAGVGNFYLPLVLGEGMTYSAPEYSAKDLDFGGGGKDARDEILATWSMPATELGLHDGGDQHVSLQNRITYQQHVARPRAKEVGASFATNILTEWDLPPGYVWACYPDPRWGDIDRDADRADMIADLGGNGTLVSLATAEEWRAKRGYRGEISDPDGVAKTLLIRQGVFGIDDPARYQPAGAGGPLVAGDGSGVIVPTTRRLVFGRATTLRAAVRLSSAGAWRSLHRAGERSLHAAWVAALGPQAQRMRAGIEQRYQPGRVSKFLVASILGARGKETKRIAHVIDGPTFLVGAKASSQIGRGLKAGGSLTGGDSPSPQYLTESELREWADTYAYGQAEDFIDATVAELQEIYSAGAERAKPISELVAEFDEYYESGPGDWRSWREARSGSTAIMGYSVKRTAQESGVDARKSWAATNDGRSRDSHLAADAEYQEGIALDAKFEVGNSRLDYPGDPTGEPEETKNCRCGLVLVRGDNE